MLKQIFVRSVCLLFVLSIHFQAAAVVSSNSLLDLAFDTIELTKFEQCVLSPDGQFLAYCTRQKPKNHKFIDQESQKTHPFIVGTKLYIVRRDGTNSLQVGSAVASNFRPSWSPDSKLLAFYSDDSGYPEAWIYDVTTGVCKKAGNAVVKAPHIPATGPQWSKDQKRLFVSLQPEARLEIEAKLPTTVAVKTFPNQETAQDKHDITKWLNSHLAAIDLETGKVSVVVSASSSPSPSLKFQISPSGTWLAYNSVNREANHPAYEVDDLNVARTDKQDAIITIDKELICQSTENCFKWHPEMDFLVYVKDKKPYLVVFDENGPQAPKPLAVGIERDFIARPLLFTPDGDNVVVVTTNPESLFILSLDSDQHVELDIGAEWKYLETIGTTAEQLWQPEKNSLTALLKQRTTGQTAVVRYNFAGDFHILWQGLASMGTFCAQHGANDIFCRYEDLQHPPELYRFSHDFALSEAITKVDLRLDELACPTVKFFDTTVPLYNGELKKVRTAVLFPAGIEPKDQPPAVVILYPGADVGELCKKFCGGDRITIPNFVLLNRGYALILPDLPIGPEGAAGNPIQDTVDVLLPQVYHAINLGYVDGTRLAVAGQSYGGYGAAAVISRTNLFRAAVAISGVYDLPGHYGYPAQNGFAVGWSENGQGRMGSHPWDNLLHYIENSPYYQAEKIHTPLLLIHGEQDEACKVHEAEKLFTALNRLDREVKLAIYLGENHFIKQMTHDNAIDATQRILTFLKEHL